VEKAMALRLLSIVLLTGILATLHCFAQGEAALPFLLISPYAEANAMGEASVANSTDNPLAMIVNPAHLGMQVGNGRFSFGYNRTDWFPGFGIEDLYYRTFAVTAGMNLNDLFDITPGLILGAGYSRVFLNLGKQIIMPPDAPDPTGTFSAYESSDQFTLSLGFDFFVKASAGISFKNIYSKLGSGGSEQEDGFGTASVNSYDYGVLIKIPVIEGVSLFREKPVRLGNSLLPYFDFNFGLALNNRGDKEVNYGGVFFSDPLPRYARIGIGIDLGFVYETENVKLRPLSFKWTREANDILVHRPGSLSSVAIEPGWKYRGGLGDINFFDEVILGKTNPETIMKSGWELGVLGVFYIRGGKFEEDYLRGNRNFSTQGIGIRFAGIIESFKSNDEAFSGNRILDFLLHHVDIRYHYSEIKTDESNHPLDNTRTHSVSLAIFK
jgi:hypothetical protein